MRRSTILVLLVLILAAGVTLRLYRLGAIPAGLFCDEAATGYDAYSIGRTGKDMWGDLLPLFFNHHGVDRVEPIETYGTVPFVALMGLNGVSIRLPAALAGTLTILLLFLFMRRRYGDAPALWAALFLAISPWHLPFSRIGFRGILAPLFTVAILWVWERSGRGLGWTIPLAGLFGLALYTYTPYWVFLPLMLLLLILFRPRRPAPFPLVIGILLFLLFSLGVLLHLTSPGGLGRTAQISVFSHPHPVEMAGRNFIDHLSPRFLLTGGDPNGRHGTPGWGVLHPVEALLILLFLVSLLRSKNREDLLWPALFLAGFIPSCFTVSGLPNALRSIAVLPFPQIMAALGASRMIRRRGMNLLLAGSFLLISLFPLRAMFVLSPLHPGGVNAEGQRVDNWWQAGMEEAVDYAFTHRGERERIYLSPSINQAYIFPLVFLPIPPERFQASRSIAPFVAIPGRDLDTVWRASERDLFIVQPGELPDAPVLHRVLLANGETAFKVVASPVWVGEDGRGRASLQR